MRSKYTVEYIVREGERAVACRFDTDAPVACAEFLAALLQRGCCITAIHRDGLLLEREQFEQFVQQAGSMLLAAAQAGAASPAETAEEADRFGFSA